MFFSKKKPPGSGSEEAARLAEVIAYHEATKHHFRRYAASPGYLDWDNQPDPFRRFEGCSRIQLPFAARDDFPSFNALLGGSRIEPHTFDLGSLGIFFEHSMALSAWKEYQGSRWALRVNPSSGNLHPTEGYVVLPPGLPSPGEGLVCHYAPGEHQLEIRSRIPRELWTKAFPDFPADGFLLGLSSIHWREAWKYGERAYRYCQHDIGHALAALSFSAAMLGWRVLLLDTSSDEEVAALFGLDRGMDFLPEEREHPDLVALVVPGGIEVNPHEVPLSKPAEVFKSLKWQGQANRLSQEHVPWDRIDAVAVAAAKPKTSPVPSIDENKKSVLRESDGPIPLPEGRLSARDIILRRRSAVAFDGKTGLPRDVFYSILAQTVPSISTQGLISPPWGAFPGPGHVDLCLFVHLVDGIPPGLYCLVRNPAREAALRKAMKRSFLWKKAQGAPEWLNLFLLLEGDARTAAARLSCGQEIAGSSAFSLGMVAEFEPVLQSQGAWKYRHLFWETGMIGQILYLCAEASGIRGTGIGCFFDDPIHDLFGFQNLNFQSLYHFTAGGPIEDQRLTSLPPYPLQELGSQEA